MTVCAVFLRRAGPFFSAIHLPQTSDQTVDATLENEKLGNATLDALSLDALSLKDRRSAGPADAVVDSVAESAEPEEAVGPLAPLVSPTYRMFWLASLFSNTGTWVHEIGAGWLMASLDGSPLMVSSVRAATALPIVLLSLPAGALSDRVDRRRMMIVVQCLLIATAATISVLTYFERISPIGLLGLTVMMGIGTVLHVPTWQASIPEIVPRKHLPQAIALGSISFNLARSAGPAVGGLLIVGLGTWAAFGINALSFGGVLLAVLLWKRNRVTPRPTDSFYASMRAGLVMVSSRGEMRRVLILVGLFVLPASSLWSLMPLIAREQLSWDARGYGYLVGSIGLGAVLAAIWLPRMRARLGVDTTLVIAMALYALGLAILSATEVRGIAVTATLLMGTGWMTVLTTLNSTAQMALPDEMRARGMSCYLSAMAMAMAGGSILWGKVATWQSPAVALAISAGVLAVVTAGLAIWQNQSVWKTIPLSSFGKK